MARVKQAPKKTAAARPATGGKALPPGRGGATQAGKAPRHHSLPAQAAAQAEDEEAPPRKRRKYRRKPGVKALQEIKYQQNRVDLIFRKLPFARLVRELMVAAQPPGVSYRITGTALEALQEAAETHLLRRFEASNICAIHGKRVTLMPKDMQCAKTVNDIMND